MRVVLDSVVLLRGLMNRAGTRVLDRYAEYEQITSVELLQEFLSVVRRPELQERLGRFDTSAPIERALEILGRCIVVEPVAVQVCRDASDDKLFGCALGGRAAYIISEDDDVLAVGEYEGIRTIRTADFLRILDRAR